MRQIGQLASEADAQRFAAYLITQGIAAHAEPTGSDWFLWVRDEDQTDRAKEELAQFRQRPNDPRYEGAERSAQQLLAEERQRREAASRNIVQPGERWKQGVRRHAPLTRALIILSIIVTLLASPRLTSPNNTIVQTIHEQLKFVNRIDYADTLANPADIHSGDPLVNVKQGEIWRLITPIFVHADPLGGTGVLHILFNMYMLSLFGGMVEDRRGTARFAGLVLFVAVVSNVAQATFPAVLGGFPFFGGMSGVLYGTFGYAWMKGKFDPASGIQLDPSTVFILMAWLFLCMTGMMGNIANVAHVGGLLSGSAAALLPILMQRSNSP